jgi:hypothetical protein
MGRPKKPEEMKKVTITISLPRELKAIALASGDASKFFVDAGLAKVKKETKINKKEIV